ncbi:hypothetical protein [Streptomyces sp. NPDC005435]|uniref:hypothetical protein n=1 Tax=Streptomyces sp. NPDC005435 TaxID=3154464 RepID=UPI003454259A
MSSPSSGWAGKGVCAVILALGTLVTGYVVVTAYTVEPDGPWDQHAVTGSRVVSGLGLALRTVMALLTWVSVKAERAHPWWYAVPAVPAAGVVLRLTLLAPQP